jgi:hypothetical protein
VVVLGWERSAVRFVLPARTARAMVARAHRFGLTAGGRLQVRDGRIVVVWSVAPRLATTPTARPVAAFALEWDTPDGQHATVREVAWDARASSEAEVWRAIDLLRGAAAD